MSEDTRAYEEHLDCFPEKERKALEEALYLEEETENAAKSTIRQINRSKKMKQKPAKRA